VGHQKQTCIAADMNVESIACHPGHLATTEVENFLLTSINGNRQVLLAEVVRVLTEYHALDGGSGRCHGPRPAAFYTQAMKHIADLRKSYEAGELEEHQSADEPLTSG